MCPPKRGCLENIVYHFLRQLWLVLGVKLMEINSNLFSRSFQKERKEGSSSSPTFFLGDMCSFPVGKTRVSFLYGFVEGYLGLVTESHIFATSSTIQENGTLVLFMFYLPKASCLVSSETAVNRNFLEYGAIYTWIGPRYWGVLSLGIWWMSSTSCWFFK